MTIFEAAGCWGDELAQALAAGGDPNARDEKGRTPLFWAAKTDERHVQLLLDAGADPNACDAQGFTPLHFAASAGGRNAAVLVGAGAVVDAADVNGHTPLLHALHNAWIEAASALLAVGADPRHADHSGESGLDVLSPRLGSGVVDETWRADAYLHGPDRVGEHLKALIDQGLEGRIMMVLAPRLRQGYFSSLGHLDLPLANWQGLAEELSAYCAERGAWQELRTLAACGLPVVVPGTLAGVAPDAAVLPRLPPGEGPYALVEAALGGGDALPFVLGQSPEAAAAASAALFGLIGVGSWPTTEALEDRRRRAVATLVAVGADLYAPATVALEAIHRVMALPRGDNGELLWDDGRELGSRHPGTVQLLTVLSTDQPWLPLLVRAARQGSPIVPMLLAAGADPAVVDRSGRGALHAACQRGRGFVRSLETVAELLEGGLAVDLADHAGWRPLMLTTDPAILAALLAGGARPELSAAERSLLGSAAERQQAAVDAARGLGDAAYP